VTNKPEDQEGFTLPRGGKALPGTQYIGTDWKCCGLEHRVAAHLGKKTVGNGGGGGQFKTCTGQRVKEEGDRKGQQH